MIAITVPVKNRAAFLPDFLQCLSQQTVPKAECALFVVDDGSTDDSADILQAYTDAHVQEYAVTRFWRFENVLGDTNTSSRDATDRQALFAHLAWLRNFLLDATTIFQCEAQWSIDSDIFVVPDMLERLLAHDLPYVSALVVNDNHDGARYDQWSRRRTNLATHSGGGFLHDTTYPLASVVETGMSGACYVSRYAALYSGARYAYHPFGEDAGYALQLRSQGIALYADTTPERAWHCMDAANIPQVRERMAQCSMSNRGSGAGCANPSPSIV